MIKKIVLLIAFSFLLSYVFSVRQNQCNTYKCSTTKVDGECASIKKNTNNYDVSTSHCKKDYRCPITTIELFSPTNVSTKTYSCQKIVKVDVKDVDVKDVCVRTKYHDESCSKNCECFSDSCSSSKCTASKKEGEVCTSNKDCMVGQACMSPNLTDSTKKCTKQKGNGESCVVDYDCNNEYACDMLKCVKYNSKANGEETGNYMNACVSRMARTDSSGKMYCDEKTLTKTQCDGDFDSCTYMWKQANKEEKMDGGCICNNDSKVSRSCPTVEISDRVVATPNVHTERRFKQQNFAEGAKELLDNFGSTLKDTFGDVKSFFSNLLSGDETVECLEELVNSDKIIKISAIFALIFSLLF